MRRAGAVTSAFEADRGFGAREAILCGVLWGVVVAAIEGLVEPARTLEPGEFLAFMLHVEAAYILPGTFLATTLLWLERRLIGARLICAAASCVLSAAILHFAFVRLSWWLLPGVGIDSMLTFIPAVGEMAAHVAWVFGFYGGVYAVGFLLFRRSSRLRQRLHRAELARTEAEIKVDRARLDERQNLLPPALLLAAVNELGRRYLVDPDGADNLLEKQVAFLRAAMPGLRTGPSDLQTEISLAVSYIDLRRELGAFPCGVEARIGEYLHRLPFPRLVLVPLIDHLAQAVAPGGWIEMSVRKSPRGIQLVMSASALATGEWLPLEMDRRLQMAVRSTSGSEVQLHLRQNGQGGGPIDVVLFVVPTKSVMGRSTQEEKEIV